MTKIPNTARGIVIRGDQILLMERWKDGQHYFSIPGGKIEKGEKKEQTVRREIQEETSIDVRVNQMIAEQRVEGSTHSIFLCDYLKGEPYLKPDSEEAYIQTEDNKFNPCWKPVNELDSLYLRYWEPLKAYIAKGLREGFPEKPAVVDV